VGRGVMVASLAAVSLVAGVWANQRNRVWSDAITLWEDTVAKSPGKARAHFQLAFAYFQAGRCQEAVEQYGRVAALEEPDYRLLVDWALAYRCAGLAGEALARLEQAAALEKTAHVYSLVGMIYGEQGKREQALEALETAEQIDAGFAMTYVYRGNVHASAGEDAQAAEEYRRALALDASLKVARESLDQTERRLRRKR